MQQAEQRIQEAFQHNSLVLNLNDQPLSTLPSSISTLTRLESLYLSNNHLTTIPESISTLTCLQSLFINNNQLTTIPESISTLTHLKSLHLNSNQLTTIPSSISTLARLELLYLNNNQLTTLPSSMSALICLKWLRLDNNRLTALPESMSILTCLELLYLKNNQLTALPSSVSTFTHLESMFISNNQLTTLSESISTLIHLKSLYLNSNQLTTLPESISTLTCLEQLSLDNNQLAILPESISTLIHLKSLHLSNNQLTTLPESMSTITCLKWLHLDNNRLTALPESISTLTCLKWLDLNNNQLTTLPESISTLTCLESLFISINQLITLPSSISTLTRLERLDLNNNQLTTLPESISTLKYLQSVHINNNQLTTLLSSISTLPHLRRLNLSNNLLTVLPESISTFTQLEQFSIDYNPLKFPPSSVANNGITAISRFFQEYQRNKMVKLKIPCSKVLIVGEGQVGKTSLVRRLQNDLFYKFRQDNITQGVNIHALEIDKAHVTVWDFAGQEEFLSSHRLFLKGKSLFVIVIKLSDSETVINKTLKKWLFIISQHAHDSEVLIVGSYIDELKQKDYTPRKLSLISCCQEISRELKMKLSRESILFISNKENTGIDNVQQAIKRHLTIKGRTYITISAMSIYEYLMQQKQEKSRSIDARQIFNNCSRSSEEEFTKDLEYLEVIGVIVILKPVEHSKEIDSWIVILSSDYLSKLYTDLRTDKSFEGDSMTRQKFNQLLPKELAKKSYSVIKLLEKCHLIYQKQNGDLFFPERGLQIAMPANYLNQLKEFTFGRVIEFKYILPVGFFEQLALSMHLFHDTIDGRGFNIFKNMIVIFKEQACIIIEKMIDPGTQFENQIRVLSFNDSRNVQLIDLVMENIENLIERTIGAERASIVATKVCCCCDSCQSEIKYGTAALKHCHLYSLLKETQNNGFALSLLDAYFTGKAFHSCRPGINTDLTKLCHFPPRLDASKLTIIMEIGSGSYGKVWSGQYDGQSVAVKEFEPTSELDLKEINILSKLNHERILKLVGVVFNTKLNKISIVTELMDCSLHALIYKSKSNLLSTDQFKRIALDIAEGIEYLHGLRPAIIHRDLKCLNILLRKRQEMFTRANIADFGTARWATSNFIGSHGTERYQAPEMTRSNNAITISADIYSFGAILFEMCNNGVVEAFEFDRRRFETVLGTLAHVPAPLKALITWCCKTEPDQRPTIAQCIEQLKLL